MEFIEAPFFTEVLPAYPGADDYRDLQRHLARDPEAGDAERRALKSAIDEELRQGAVNRRARGK